MADVTSDSTQAGGLGTKPARWVFVFVWACGVWLGVIDGYLSPFDLLNAAAYTAGFVGGLLLTSSGPHRLPQRQAVWLPVIAIFITMVALDRAPAVMDVWAVTFAAYLVGFLFPRGNPVAAGIGSALVVGYAFAWGVAKDPSGADLAYLLGIPVGCVVAGIVWRLVLHRLVRKERAHRGAAAHASERAAAFDEAIAASQTELMAIRTAVAPLLSRIEAGEPIDQDLRTQLTLVEASIRDRIRAPQLQHPLVVAASVRLRTRGVTVVVLGEPSTAAGTIGTPLADHIVDLIASTAEGRVTIRSLPEGRSAAVSVVVQSEDASEQVLLDHDGELISRA